jgi:hypothetical protein
LDLVPEVLPGEARTQRQQPPSSGGAGIQMREDVAEQYLSYKLIDSNVVLLAG